MATPPEHIKAYSLTLLGTDTEHEKHLEGYYVRGETLTAIFHGIEGERGFDIKRGPHTLRAFYRKPMHFVHHTSTTGAVLVSAADRLKSITKDIIDGPDSLGYLPPEKIAEATLRILYQIAKGEKNIINLTAHSRGSVEAMLVIHELDRIRKALQEASSLTSAQLEEIICNSPDSKTKEALQSILPEFRELFGSLHSGSEPPVLTQKMQQTKINLFALDPVPGGDYRFFKVGWKDDRFDSKLPPLNSVVIKIPTHEMTEAFGSLIPNADDCKAAGVTVLYEPGHHGTASGNPFHQGGQEIILEDKSVADTFGVQDLTACQLTAFLQKNGQRIDPTHILERAPSEYEEHFKKLGKRPILGLKPLSEIVSGFIASSNKARYLLSIYNSIAENRASYEKLATGSYNFLGQQQLFWRWSPIGMAYRSRLVQHGKTRGTPLPEASIHRGEHYFVNAEHAQLEFIVWAKELLGEDTSSDDEAVVSLATLRERYSLDVICKKALDLVEKLTKPISAEARTGDDAKAVAVSEIEQVQGKILDFFGAFSDYILESLAQGSLSHEDKANVLETIRAISTKLAVKIDSPVDKSSPFYVDIVKHNIEVEHCDAKDILKVGFLTIIQKKTTFAFRQSLESISANLNECVASFGGEDSKIKLEAAHKIILLEKELILIKERFDHLNKVESVSLFIPEQSGILAKDIQTITESCSKLAREAIITVMSDSLAQAAAETADRTAITEAAYEELSDIHSAFTTEAIRIAAAQTARVAAEAQAARATAEQRAARAIAAQAAAEQRATTAEAATAAAGQRAAAAEAARAAAQTQAADAQAARAAAQTQADAARQRAEVAVAETTARTQMAEDEATQRATLIATGAGQIAARAIAAQAAAEMARAAAQAQAADAQAARAAAEQRAADAQAASAAAQAQADAARQRAAAAEAARTAAQTQAADAQAARAAAQTQADAARQRAEVAVAETTARTQMAEDEATQRATLIATGAGQIAARAIAAQAAAEMARAAAQAQADAAEQRAADAQAARAAAQAQAADAQAARDAAVAETAEAVAARDAAQAQAADAEAARDAAQAQAADAQAARDAAVAETAEAVAARDAAGQQADANQAALNRLLQENAQLKRAKIINTRAIMIGCTVGLLVTAAVGGVILTVMFAPAVLPVIIASTVTGFIGLSLTGITVGVAVKSVLLTLGLGALAGLVTKSVSEPIVGLATSTPNVEVPAAPTAAV